MREGWEIKKFEKSIEKIVYTIKIKRKDFLNDGAYPIVSQEKNLINGYWDSSVDLFKIKKPVVIFGDHTKTVKYIDFDFVLGADGVKILQPITEIDSRYFYYYLLNVDLGDLGYARHYRLLKEVEVNYPKSLQEQKRIVSILDRAFEAIDKAKANAEQNLINAKALFESYLQGVFEKKGDDWAESLLNEITEVKDGTHDSPKYIKEGIPFVTQKNIKPDGFTIENTKFITEADHQKFYKRSNVTFGDILISMIGANRGMAAIVNIKDTFSIKNVGLIKESENINQHFLLYYLQSKLAMKYVLSKSNGGAQEFIGLRALRAFPIPFPKSKEEQNQIVKKLDALSAETIKLESIYQQKIDDLEELKKSVLQKAFAGELTEK
jgi:type I restriction enzyme S subunit